MRKVIIGLSLFCIGGLYAQQTNVYTDIQRYFNEGKVLRVLSFNAVEQRESGADALAVGNRNRSV